jgi:type III secretory pathway component EscT
LVNSLVICVYLVGCLIGCLVGLTLALFFWSASRLGRFIPDTRGIEGWLGPRTGLDDLEQRKIKISN